MRTISILSLSKHYFFVAVFLIGSGQLFAQATQGTQETKDKKQASKLSTEQPTNKDSLELRLKKVKESYQNQDYSTTVESGRIGMNRSKNDPYIPFYVQFASNVGLAYQKIGDTVKSKTVFQSALKKAKETENNSFILGATIDLANAHKLYNEYEEALKLYKSVLPIIDSANAGDKFIVNYSIADSHFELDQLKTGKPFLLTAKKEVKKLSNVVFELNTIVLEAKYLYGEKKYLESSKLLEKNLEKIINSGDVEIIIDAYKFYSAAEKQQRNFQKATELEQLAAEYEQKRFEIQKVNAVEMAKVKSKLQEIERESELKLAKTQQQLETERTQRDQKKARAIALWSTIALAVTIIVLVILFISFRKSRKLSQNLAEKNTIYLREREKSEKLLAARNALFSRISHELRTPMYGIVGISNILLEDKTCETQFDNIQSLKYSADYLLSLINNVLEMNKLNRSSNPSIIIEEFNLRDLCDHAAESSKYISKNHTNTFKVEIDESIHQVYLGDAVKLMQVLINLLGNANKFTKNGMITLKVNKVGEKDTIDQLDFKVIDTGKGITPEKLIDIFDETKFIDQNEENEGTGLGLPISKKMLELQGSELNIISEPNNGTTMEFVLEYTRVQHQEEDNDEFIGDLSNLKILIVEDNKINQLVTKKTIQSLNGQFDVADSGEQAIQLVKNNKYDVVLMDINMPPGMNGFEAAMKIREFNSDVPIIALTAVEQLEIEERIKSSAMNDYLIKPFKNKQFVDTLQRNIVTV